MLTDKGFVPVSTRADVMPRILMVLAQDWFFLSHFVDRAKAARQAGYEVIIAARDDGDAQAIRELGFAFHSVAFERRGVNPFREMRTVFALARLYRDLRPDIVHHVALKPIVHGTLASRIAGIRSVINAPVGMGFLFSSQTLQAKLLRPFMSAALKLLLNPVGSMVIVENSDDRAGFVAAGQARAADIMLIRGAGVDANAFRAGSRGGAGVTVIMVARALSDKGLFEYVEAARYLKARFGTKVTCRFVGAPDPGNPASVDGARLRAWHDEGVIEWLGHRNDIADLLAESDIAALPSYREGLPKSLLEAMAAELPVVTTDAPGCREVVRDTVDGLIVPIRDAAALSEALLLLIMNRAMRQKLGAAGRARVLEDFTTERVCEQTLAVYVQMFERTDCRQ